MWAYHVDTLESLDISMYNVGPKPNIGLKKWKLIMISTAKSIKQFEIFLLDSFNNLEKSEDDLSCAECRK